MSNVVPCPLESLLACLECIADTSKPRVKLKREWDKISLSRCEK